MTRSCRIVRIDLPGGADELSEIVLELLRRNSFKSDVYIRPLAYKAARVVKVALHGLRDGFGIYAFPLGDYLPTGGLAARTASWRRISDEAIPARGKITGAYVNTALAVDEAVEFGADEAIFLTSEGHVSEGGGSNLFMVRDGELVTPCVTEEILEGITRETLVTIAREAGYRVVERKIDRTELFIADEVFFCGTGAQVAPCVRVDDIRVARSHPQALAQVDDFLRARAIEPQVAYDTAGAAADVAAAAEGSVAAVASKRAGQVYGLTVLAEAIETTPDNFTRFFALARRGDEYPTKRVPDDLRLGTRKTSLAYATANVPGALTRSLQPFATAGLQLTKVESRPSRAAPWDYVFYLDFEGDPVRTPTTEALALMRTCCAWIQVLGTYPGATKVIEPD